MQQDPSIPAQPTNTTPQNVVVSPVDTQQNELPESDPDTGVTASEGSPKRSGWRSVLSTIGILLAAPLIAVALTAFVFQSYEVDGPSMETTLQNHDRLIVWKVPRTISRITNNDYIPERGDVIIFVKHDLYEEPGGNEKQLIKRVIGVPGDRVVVADGHITIYNHANPQGFDPDVNTEFSRDIVKPTEGSVDLLVGEGEVFVAGDNRVNSLDSRAFGTVKSHDIVGRMVLRIYPFNGLKSYI